MDNHVHLILTPSGEDGLRATLGEAHRRYTRMINFREGWRGHLFQRRFASYPMDAAHLMAAVRYVENNPVEAGLVERAQDWPWSSAQSHVQGRRARHDPLTDMHALVDAAPNWTAMLRHGLEAGGTSAAGEAVAEAIEARLRTGRPLAAEDWIVRHEATMGRATCETRAEAEGKRRWQELIRLPSKFPKFARVVPLLCARVVAACDGLPRWEALASPQLRQGL